MNHRTRHLAVLFALLALPFIAKAAAKPNIIVTYTDDHGHADLGIRATDAATAALRERVSWGWFDFRRKGESMDEGDQSPPVNWGLSSERKRAFFKFCAEISGAPKP